MRFPKATFGLLIILLIATIPIPITKAYPIPQTQGFGNTNVPEIAFVNWTRFWQLFNKHSAWDLEYNEGLGWISVKEDLEVIRQYFVETSDGDIASDKNFATKCKITLNFTASHTANYRLTFAIDVAVKNHTYKEGKAKYILSYQNYTVFFDFSDLLKIKNLIFNHGVKTINGKNWFWFRARKDNVPKGIRLTLDPSFGYENAGQYYVSIANCIRGSWFSCLQKGIANNITVYLSPVSSGNVTCAIYQKTDNSLIGQTEERTIPEEANWYTFNFTQTIYISDMDYVLNTWSNKYVLIYGDSQTAKGRYQLKTYTGNFPNSWNPTTHDSLYSIYCNYTLVPEEEDEGEPWYVPPEEKPPLEEISETIEPVVLPLSKYGLYIIIGVIGILILGGAYTQLSTKKVYRKPKGRISRRTRGPKGRFKPFKPKRRKI